MSYGGGYLPPGTPGPYSETIEVSCPNEECDLHGVPIEIHGEWELGGFFPVGKSEDRLLAGCEVCESELEDV